MSYTPAIDISQWQGVVDFTKISEPIVIMRASYSYQGVNHFDTECGVDYPNAKANGKAVGLYHFAGGTDPIAEADFFLKACSPLAQYDVLILDWEIEIADPVSWCQKFIQHIIDNTNTIPMIYMDTDRENRFDWSPIVKMGVGLWIADYRYTPDQNVPIKHWPYYVMHQFNSNPIDHDAYFGPVDSFKKYGWEPPAPVVSTPPPLNTPPVAPIQPVIPEPPVAPVVIPPTIPIIPVVPVETPIIPVKTVPVIPAIDPRIPPVVIKPSQPVKVNWWTVLLLTISQWLHKIGL